MANDVLKAIADDIGQINKSIIEATELIDAAKEAGEDTTELEGEVRKLRIRKEKWERMLTNRGITIPKL